MISDSFKQYQARLREFIARSQSADGEISTGGLANHLPDFEGLALELFALQFEHNLPYRKLCHARGISPETVANVVGIPVVSTAAFKDLEITSIPDGQRRAVFHSSGTTGHRPSRHFHHQESLGIYEDSLLAWFYAQFPPGSGLRAHGFGFLSPPPVAAPHSSLAHMFDTLRRQQGAAPGGYFGGVGAENAWTVDFPAAIGFLQTAIAVQKPVFLFGTAFSFVHVVDYLARRRESLALPEGSRILETGGYKGRSRALPKPELHALITRYLGVAPEAILCEYGMSELSSQAYDTPAPGGDRLFRFPPWARARIVSPETGEEVPEGERGVIRVIDLANVYSVLAIETQDIAIRRRHGFELVGRDAEVELRGCSLMAA